MATVVIERSDWESAARMFAAWAGGARLPNRLAPRDWDTRVWSFGQLHSKGFWLRIQQFAQRAGDAAVLFLEQDAVKARSYEVHFGSRPSFRIKSGDLGGACELVLSWPGSDADALRWGLNNPVWLSEGANWFIYGDTYLELGIIASKQGVLDFEGFSSLDADALRGTALMGSLDPQSIDDFVRQMAINYVVPRT